MFNLNAINQLFINGLFKFIIPALITFAASYLALEKSVELMQLKFDLKIEQCEKDFNNHKIDNEKLAALHNRPLPLTASYEAAIKQ